MTLITIRYGLPFVEVSLYANQMLRSIANVLLDTGSAACVFQTDDLLDMGVTITPADSVRFMTGIGGREAVIEKEIEAVAIGSLRLNPFRVQLGAMDYGFPIRGIIGMDFLIEAKATLDLKNLTIF